MDRLTRERRTSRRMFSNLATLGLMAGLLSSFAFSPGWSPDGTSILFSIFLRKAEEGDIYRRKPTERT